MPATPFTSAACAKTHSLGVEACNNQLMLEFIL
jgi:hypothetical protein